MARISMAAIAAIALTGFCGVAQAQGLIDFVNDPATNASELQMAAGTAVQKTCSQLASEAGGAAAALAGALGPVKTDLFLRCNEMVQTSNDLLGRPGTARSLGYEDRDQLLAAIQQVSGEEISAQGSLSTQVSAGQFANIGGRLNALRLGTRSAGSSGFVADLADDPQQIASRARRGSGASADVADVSNPIGWFLESSYGFGDHDQTDNEDAFDFDAVSVTTGADYNFGSGVAGISVGFDRYKADFSDGLLVSGGDVEVKGVSGSLFASWFGNHWSLSGIGTYGSLSSDVSRVAQYASENSSCALGCGTDRVLTGSPDGDYVALGITLGYQISAGGWDIVPSLGAVYRDVNIDGYTELDSMNGGLALQYGDQEIKSTRSIVTVSFSRPISRSFGVLVPNLQLEWHHEFEDDVRALQAKYAADTTSATCAGAVSCFTFLTDQPESDFGVASLGLSAVFARRVQAYFIYEALLGVQNLTSNSIAIGLRGQF